MNKNGEANRNASQSDQAAESASNEIFEPQPSTPIAEPSYDSVLHYLLYGLSLPERALRSTTAIVGGAVRESASLFLPNSFRNSKSYTLFVKQMLDFLCHDVGGVKSEPTTGPQEPDVEGFVAKKAVSNFIDITGLATLHISPMAVLAIVSDIAYGSTEYLRQLSDELKREGVIDKETTIDHAADLLQAISVASSRSADAFGLPPLSVDGLQKTIEQTVEAAADIHPERLLPQAEISRLWKEMADAATREHVSLFAMSSTMAMYTVNRVGKIGRGALSTVRIAGSMFDKHIFNHYQDALKRVAEKGFYKTLSEASQPYFHAVWQNFSPKRSTITEDVASGRFFSRLWRTIVGWFSRRKTAVLLSMPLFIFTAVGPQLAGINRAGSSCCFAEETRNPIEFIDTSIENASPLWYEFSSEGEPNVAVNLTYDHERSSPNRAAGHIHFLIHATPGSKFVLEFKNLDNIYNGRPGSVANELKAVVVSNDGKVWRSVATRTLPGNRVFLDVTMSGPKLYVARVEPYRLSDLEEFLGQLKTNRSVEVQKIGKTVEGRDVEMIRIGKEDAPFRAVLRARAHPWEAGGNWIVEGFIRRLLEDDDEAKRIIEKCCFYVLPMANKDGVARGRTRFNLNGKDLNRNWDQVSDQHLAPENYALENWLKRMIDDGRRPHFVLEIHNDGNGRLHLNAPTATDRERYLARMKLFEDLLKKHTWFSVGNTPANQNIGTLPNGWYERYGVDGGVHEFNCQWIESLKEPPLAKHWKQYGAGLTRVFLEFSESP